MTQDLVLDFETLSPALATLGESPVWSPAERCVWWVDVPGRTLFRTRADDGRTDQWVMPEQLGFAAPMTGGGLVLGMESGLFRFDTGSGDIERLVAFDEPGTRFNDAAVDGAGRLWAATVDLDNRRPVGVLYRILPDLSVSAVVSGLVTANGLAVDDARGRLYLSDSHPDVQAIWVADLDGAGGAVGDRRVLAHMHDMAGRPDGAAVDADGTYWIAGVGGGVIHGFDAAGRHVAEIPTPCDDPTKLVFGGADLDRLFLTSKAGPGSGGALATAAAPATGRPPCAFG